MKLAALVAALAAIGGLQTAQAVEAVMREAAAPAPERDFRALMEVVSGAIRNVINAGRPPGEQRYVHLQAIYADRAVIELDGKLWQYGYAITVVNGTEQITLSPPVAVVPSFVPVTAGEGKASVKEALEDGDAGVFREAADGSIEVTLVRAGASGNRNYYPDAVLREAVPLFEGVRVFVKSDEQHIKGGGKDVRNLVGGVYSVRFVEGKTPDTGALVGVFRPLSDTDEVVTKMREAVKRGMQDLLGLSIDAVAKIKKRTEGKQVFREATKFVKVDSVDLIVEPGAGGGLDRLTEAQASDFDAAATPSTIPNSGEEEMKKRLYEAIKKRNAQRAAAINLDTISDDELMNIYEAVMAEPAPADASTQRVAEAAAGNGGADAPVTRAELQMFNIRQAALSKIAASTLPAPAKERLTAHFGNLERFTEAQVDESIKSEREYLARFTESGSVRVPAFGAGSIEVGDKSVQIKDMLDAFFDPAHQSHGSVQSLRECYIEITGDRRVTGELRSADLGRMAEALGVMREAISSSTFADALGDSITRRMQAVYTGLTDLDAWRRVATWGPVSDFRTQERIRIGGYGNLPGVNQGADYAALTSPGDDKATYAVTKRGGLETVTLEAIKNDDVQALRRIPVELALAAKNTLYEFVFDFFRLNAAIYDTKALYHVDHANLFSAAFSAGEYATHRLAMLKMTRAGSGKRLATPPKTLLVPFELEESAFNAFQRATNLDKTFVQSNVPDIIGVAHWTDANDWCTVADPARLPVLEIGFLDGREDPELFVQDTPTGGSMFASDKLTYKIRHIYGGTVLVDGEKGTTKAVVAA
jgi:hypothetical protein